jgi:hypothetical protein
MVIERAFGILKGRWRILLKRIDMPLHHLPSIVIAIFCLHNLCIIHGDAFDMDWAREAKMEMQRKWQTWNFSKKKRYIPHACNTIK